MYGALTVRCGRGRLLRYMFGCVLVLLFLQCFLSLLAARRAVYTSFFQFEAAPADAAPPRLLLGLGAAGGAAPARPGSADPLLARVMTDKGAKSAPPPAANGTAAAPRPAAVPADRAAPPAANGSGPAQQNASAPSDGRELCPPVPLKLVGPVAVPTSAPSWEEMEAMEEFRRLKPGGHYQPPDCVARHRVAIIVPYRDREEHLRIFLYHMHPILQRQQLDYRIFVVEQAGADEFNRASLLNAGAMESVKLYDFQCFIFHDIDLLMEDDRNLYTCPQQPRHMSVAIDTMNYRLPYTQLFGGASAMSREHFQLVNGFSNQYWGWGGEDDDMTNRIIFHHLHVARYPANIARYKMLKHKHGKVNPKRFDLLRKGKKRFATDGLSSLRYEVKDLVLEQLYTRLLIEVGKR